ncbi:MAG TPA: flagellar export chaperone FlgN [Atribacteraceae bacterium]|nr:flagellar export chaperone FlgN [Atribacteraceae bacterium]
MKELSDYLDFLLDLIGKEIEVQECILQIAGEKRRVLRENHIEELLCYLRQEETLLLQAQDLEREMNQVWKKMCNEHSLNLPVFRLADLIDLADDEQAQLLSKTKEHLSTVVRDLEVINRQNALLIKEALEYINIVFSLLVEGPPEKSGALGYAPPGGKEGPGKNINGLFIDGTV